jgi:hypothetical protein
LLENPCVHFASSDTPNTANPNISRSESTMRARGLRSFWIGASAIAASIGLAASGLADHNGSISPSPEASHTRPIPLGTSGGSLEHLLIKGRLFCYTGTLGALVEDINNRYILSNNHVLAKENELLNSGGSDATIIQPGLLDEGTCTISSGNAGNAVGTLSNYVLLEFGKGKNKPANHVDAAIAVIDNGQVASNGAILGIGTVNGVDDVLQDVDRGLGMQVQKTGRTTAHTFGTIEAFEAEIDVKYESGTARFVNQIRIRHACDSADFSASGDSGSLIVTVPVSGEPSAVGLLFAGGDADTFANPIQTVLDELSVSLASADDGIDNEGAMASDFQTTVENCPADGGSGKGGGGGRGGGPGGPPFGAIDPIGLSTASDVKARHSEEIFALPEVVGHGISMDENGNPVIEIYVSSKAKRAAGRPIPADIEGISVRVVETGVIRAF